MLRSKRIQKACQSCSSRRRRCDGLRPRCSTCARMDVECRYVDSGKKRGRPSRGSRPADRSATTPHARIHQQSPDGEVFDHHSCEPAPSVSEAEQRIGTSSQGATSPSTSNGRVLRTNTRARLAVYDDGKDDRDGQHALAHLTDLLTSTDGSTFSLCKLAPSMVRFHFDIYWRHVHSHWQILYKPAITAIPEARLASEVEQPLFDSIICLTATMAIRSERDRETVDQIAQAATLDIMAQLLTPRLSVVQALLLHSLRFYGIGELRKAILLTSCASQLSIDLGMHLDRSATADSDPGQHQSRLRALWSCYCLDKVLSAEMERPPAFRIDGVSAELLSEFEPDEFEIVYQTSDLIPGSNRTQPTLGRLHAASSLNLTVRTYRILEQALLSPINLHTDGDILQRDLLSSWTRSLALDRDLDNLAASWPDQFRLHNSKALAVPGVACLVIWFHLTKIINYRPYLLLQDRLSHTASNIDLAPSAQVAATICLSSASAIVQLFGAIPRASLRYISGNNAFSIFTAASILLPYSTHESLSIARECKASVHKCFVWLDDMAATWPIARKHRKALDDMAHFLRIPFDEVLQLDPQMDVTSNAEPAQRLSISSSEMANQDMQQHVQGLSALFHNRSASPLGFRGQLALRPFATPNESNNDSMESNQSNNGSRQSRHERATSRGESQADALSFFDGGSDATTVLDELCLDPSIQALVRQSLSRDTSLWDSTAFKEL